MIDMHFVNFISDKNIWPITTTGVGITEYEVDEYSLSDT